MILRIISCDQLTRGLRPAIPRDMVPGHHKASTGGPEGPTSAAMSEGTERTHAQYRLRFAGKSHFSGHQRQFFQHLIQNHQQLLMFRRDNHFPSTSNPTKYRNQTSLSLSDFILTFYQRRNSNTTFSIKLANSNLKSRFIRQIGLICARYGLRNDRFNCNKHLISTNSTQDRLRSDNILTIGFLVH